MRIILIFPLLIFAFSALGQNIKIYNDAYGTQGEIKYTGSLPDSLLPENGNYTLRWRDMNRENISTYYIDGKINGHQPTGVWVWEEALWKYDIHPGSQIIPDFKSHGEREMWRGSFSGGKANGEWVYQKDSIQPVIAGFAETLKIQGVFKNGELIGKFSVDDARQASLVSLDGNCNSNGNAHGKWTFLYRNESGNQVTEVREYENGFLIRSSMTDGINTDKFENENLAQTLKNIPDENDSSLHMVVGDSAFTSDYQGNRAMEILNEYLYQNFFGGWEHPNFHYRNQRQGIYFRRIQYPLSIVEKRIVDSLLTEVKEFEKEIETRLNYRNILVNRGRTDSLDLAISYLVATQIRVEHLDSLLGASLKNPFTYLNRYSAEIRALEPQLNEPLRAEGVFHPELSAKLPQIAFKENEIHFFQSLVNYHSELHEVTTPYLKMVDQVRETILKETDIAILTDQISEKRIELNTLYDTLSGTGAFVRQHWVVNHINLELEKFTRAEIYQDAKTLGNEILDKMEALVEWAPEWTRYDNMTNSLREQYTVYAYNPYTGKRDIEVRLKRRFFSTIENTLSPWIKSQTRSIDNWNEFANHVQLTRMTYDQLSAFAQDEGTRAQRLERRVRKERNPERIIRLLDAYNNQE